VGKLYLMSNYLLSGEVTICTKKGDLCNSVLGQASYYNHENRPLINKYGRLF